MKKPVATALLFLFSVSVLLSGAFGYSDCAARCAYEMAKAQQHASMGTMGLAAPNCCAGTMKNSCEMAQVFEIKIPECSVTCHQTVSPDPLGAGVLSDDSGSDGLRSDPSNRRSITAETIPKHPLYLAKRSLLC